MKTVVKILLGLAIVLLAYLCVMSVLTPIQFEKDKTVREKEVVAKLIQIRTAELEFKGQYGHYTADWDSLLNFVATGNKKEVKKEGALTEAQLEAGLTEAKAVKIVNSGNQKEIVANGLQNFRRDTILSPMIEKLYAGVYTPETIGKMAEVPYGNGAKFELEVNNSFVNSSGIAMPLFEARTPYEVYLSDLNHQEVVNAKDVAEKLDHYAGLKVGSVEEPNNNAGNWE